jgi:hypothetical protein
MLRNAQKIFIGISILAFVLLLIFRIQLIGYYDNSVGSFEFNILHGIQKILSGQTLYTNPELPPFDIIQKTPLYYYLVAGFAKIMGLIATDVMPLLRLNRIIALLLNIGTLAVFYRIFRVITLAKRYAAFSICSILFYVFTEHYFTKMDALYILFFAIIVYLLVKNHQNFQVKHALYLGALSGLMILSKQTGIFLIILILPFLCTQKNRFQLLITSGLSGLGCLIFFFLVMDIEIVQFYRNTFLGLENGIQTSSLINVFNSEFQLPVLLTGFLVSYLCWIKKERIGQLLAYATFFFLIIGILSLLKVGAGMNYLTEYKIMLLLSLVYLIFNTQKKSKYLLLNGVYFGIAILILGVKITEIRTVLRIEHYVSRPEDYFLEKDFFLQISEEFSLSENQYYYFPDRSFINLFFFDKGLFPNENVNLEVLHVENAALDFHSLQAQLNGGLIEYVILQETTRISEVSCLDTPLTRFDLVKNVKTYNIYKWNKKEN